MKDRNTSKHLCLCFGLLPMLNIYQFIFYNFLRLRFQRVHQPPAHGVTGFQFLGDARCLQHTGQHGIHALLLSKWLIFFSKALLFHPWRVSCDSHEAQAQAEK